MKRAVVWFVRSILVIVALIVIGVALAPASLVSMAAARWAPQIHMSEPTGTIWRGQSDQVMVTFNQAKLELGKLNWKLSPLSVLTINPSVDITIEAPAHQAQVRVSATRDQVVTVDKMEGEFPLSMLEPWVPLLVKGDLAFVVDHIVFTRKELLAIDGVFNLQQADWLGGDVDMPLGSYIAQVSLDDNKDIFIQINDFSATLGIDGHVTISPKGTYHFQSVLQTRDGLAPEVAQSVSWFGKKNAQGDIVVDNTGRWN